MNDLIWKDALAAPRSLATRSDTAVVVIEDLGVIDYRLRGARDAERQKLDQIFGGPLPQTPWHVATTETCTAVWIRPDRWRLLCAREAAPALASAVSKASKRGGLSDLTGTFASLRMVGAAADEALMRVCSIDLSTVEPQQARRTRVAGVASLLVRQTSASWLVLVPRSNASFVAAALSEALRTPARLNLFQPADAPPV